MTVATQETNTSQQEIRESVAWLLLAYSIGHSETCPCEHCGKARRTMSRVAEHDAA